MIEIVSSTVDNPIAWFESLIVKGLGSRLHNDFKEYAKQQGGYFMPVHPYNGMNDETVFYIDFEQNQEMHSSVHKFSAYLENKLQEEYRNSIYIIDTSSLVKDRYQKLSNILSSLINLSDEIDFFGMNDTLKEIVVKLFAFINKETGVSVIEENTVKDIFGFTKGTKSIKLLYEILVELRFFDEDINQYDIFNLVLTTIPNHKEIKLTISCNNQTAAYILRKIEPLFNRLTFRNISTSKIFYNKRGKLITETDLSKALNSFQRKIESSPSFAENIDDFLNKIL